MALPNAIRGSMLPVELEFIASEELIQIMPMVKMEKIRFVSVRCVIPVLILKVTIPSTFRESMAPLLVDV